jgi:hypothetical protein
MPASNRDSDGFAKNRATEGEGFASRRATEDDDVEGHRFIHARDGVNKKRDGEGDDFHAAKKASEDDDVEGHAFTRLRSPSSRGE